MAKVKQAKIADLVPDDLNMNKGCEFGQRLVENSIRQFGAGRSILLDKNNRIIAGNKFTENAADVGLEKVIIVETTGDEIVAVKRTDVDLDSAFGREMAAADNATAKADIVWDVEVIQEVEEKWNIDVEKWGIDIDLPEEPEDDEPEPGPKPPQLIVTCKDAAKLSILFSELKDRGFDVEMNE